jgi:hypothetical protein
MAQAKQPPPKRPIHQDKDLDKLVKQAWKAGWRCVRKNNYIYCYPPGDGPPVLVKSTPSSSRYPRNLKQAFRRAGLDL